MNTDRFPELVSCPGEWGRVQLILSEVFESKLDPDILRQMHARTLAAFGSETADQELMNEICILIRSGVSLTDLTE